jgi:voltage-gated potassium channel Kch
MSVEDKQQKRPSAGKPTLGGRLRYRFDAALSRGPSVVITWLGLLTLAVIVFTALILTAFQMTGVSGSSEALAFPEALWQSLTRVLDAGTFVGEVGWPTRLVGLFVTISGVFIAGSLIGLIASAVDQQITELRKGRSNVIESDHTLILGWSSRVPAIISELIIANESRKQAAVVILADVDKTEMEETLRNLVPDMKNTQVVCRSGVPWTAASLEMANMSQARSIVIVGGGRDTVTVKALLGLRAARGAGDGTPRAHIVAEVVDADTAQSLRSLMGAGLVTVSSENVVAELTAQACRQRGLSGVFRELLDFDGDELYFAPFPQLVGRTYAAAQLAFEKCAVIGILDRAGTVVLNPAPSTVFGAEDQLIAIVEDDSVFVPSPISVTPTVQPMEPPTAETRDRRIVIAGWSSLGPRVITELDEFLDARTTIELMLDPDLVDIDAIRAEVSTRNVRLEISALGGGPEFVAAHAARRSFHEVIVLGYRNVLDDDDADARTLLTLLAFNQVRQADDVGPVRIVAEMLDQRNAPLAEATGVDDFVVSDELTSLMLAQLSERQELSQVFLDLFDRDGCSIELRAAPIYGAQHATTFADVVATASARGDSAIGYRLASSGQVVVNPAKSAPLALGRQDEVLVIAPGLVPSPASSIAREDDEEAIGITVER